MYPMILLIAAGLGLVSNLAGAVDPVGCSNSTHVFADGTACEDGNQYTRPDTCLDGTCQSGQCRVVVFRGLCQATCPEPFVRDQSTCVSYTPECGEYCIECNADNTCKRCEFSKKLDGTVCSDECRAKDSFGNDLFTTSPQGKTCDPFEEPSTSSSNDSTMMMVIIGCGAVVGLALIIVLFCCCCRKKQPVSAEELEAIELNTVTGSAYDTKSLRSMRSMRHPDDVETAGGNSKQKEKFNQTLRRLGSKSKDLVDIDLQVDASIEHIIDSTPTSELAPDQAKHFFRELDRMRKDRNTYAIILKEMKTRLSSAANPTSHEKYSNIVADLVRLLRLFRQEASNREVYVDAMKLLDWSKRMLDQYLNAKLEATA